MKSKLNTKKNDFSGNLFDLCTEIFLSSFTIFIEGLKSKKIKKIGDKKGLNVQIKSKNNPRLEAERHYYKADHNTLRKFGFKRINDIDFTINEMLNDLIPHKKRIQKNKRRIRANAKRTK